ncbi:hypothetical protein B0T26DRAFT_742188 [Lasiosphaeria miniovina]|uniref:FAD-binding domain-containing protein n=1 Tax=Lasiosphaeria miniovina TaxID=1954250 RepID=A0AA40ACX8_9PEZI|nr:uncharacterized protein B0T26DRAFT_742188 [Lasiosphaeria miniovina]KAK0713561.1 hypothetical protein B0T26DRAFT_742188 [Lasiosphaeria miniovina]
MAGAQPQLDVAIIGGGVVGLIMAMGLMKRGIRVVIYEQSREFREIGAGIAFTANAIKCMSLLDPAIVAAVDAVATPNGEDADKPNDYVRFHDGYRWDPADAADTEDKLLGLLHTGYKGFQGCHRAHLLDELVKSIPPSAVAFCKRFVGHTDPGPGEKLVLQFADGTTAQADAVIGCDGIKSKVRQVLLGADSPASYPHFSHKVAYRALVPMAAAEAALGTFKARNQHMHTGPGAHLLHFPVAGGTLLNVVAFVADAEPWPLTDAHAQRNMTADATRGDLEAVFAGWCPTVRHVVALLPDMLSKWALFDTHDHPAPTYVCQRVCVAGDAAHASSPHHGGGAGIGVEDALALCTLLEMATGAAAAASQADMTALVERAFAVYDVVRRPRSQWLVASSREVCDIYEWSYPPTMADWDKCMAEITARSHRLWYFDIDGMLAELRAGFDGEASPNPSPTLVQIQVQPLVQIQVQP